jgi:hypothetical protein
LADREAQRLRALRRGGNIILGSSVISVRMSDQLEEGEKGEVCSEERGN